MDQMKRVIIFGNGQIADIIFDYFSKNPNIQVDGFCVHDKFKNKQKYRGKPLIKISDLKKNYPPKKYLVHVALSYSDNNCTRMKVFNQIKKMGYKFANYIDQNQTISTNTKIGQNVVILDGNSIQPYSQIKDNVYIWSGCIIGHHSIIKSHSWITSGANIGGNSEIGEKTFVGLNATVGNMVKVGNDCFIGANALVTKNLKNKKVCIESDTKLFSSNINDFKRLTSFK
jgi:sugar O-acyltransferase (sialic acid O-acetyltransferase NeuD family)